MIPLERDREKHEVDGQLKHLIPGGLRDHHLRNKNHKLLTLKRQKGDLDSSDFNRNFWKPAKEALKAESSKKCAYCEAPTSVVAHGDVEHFRPKSTYWWLAYCYDNYLYSCQLCNQTYKSNNFPVEGTRLAGPAIDQATSDARLDQLATGLCPDPIKIEQGYRLDTYVADCRGERASLLNPYIDDPTEHIAWEAIPALNEVRVIPSDSSSFSRSAVSAMERFYGLNREELCRLRWDWFDVLVEFRDDPNLSADRVAEKKRKLKRLIGRDRPFSGMARYFVFNVWRIDLL